MRFALIICTYQRPQALQKLLISLEGQVKKPDQVIIVDGSVDDRTEEMVAGNDINVLQYFHVSPENRGLTNQRNFGLAKIEAGVEVVHFLDDDVLLDERYFQQINASYLEHPEVLGIGGYITNEVNWERISGAPQYDEYSKDGWKRKLGSRNLLRKRLGILSPAAPGKIPDFSNALPISFLPPTGKLYPVDFFMGCSMSFRKKIFENLQFSEYFHGYGLYEDLDFCIRVSKEGPLMVDSSALLEHYHEASGRPDHYKYGVMVMRNGWYVWRRKFDNPGIRARLKWNFIAGTLCLVRFGNVINPNKRTAALKEGLGRVVGWWSLLFNKPRLSK